MKVKKTIEGKIFERKRKLKLPRLEGLSLQFEQKQMLTTLE